MSPSSRRTFSDLLSPTSGQRPLARLLLACGIAASLLFAAADLLGGLLYPGYSFVWQYVSELSAIGSPSRPLVVPLSLCYAALTILFGLGVRWAAGDNGRQRLVGNLLIAYGILCLAGPFTPMHQRGVQPSLTDTLHVVGAVLDVLFIFLIIGVGAGALGRRFRLYSYGTIGLFLLGAVVSFSLAGGVGSDQSTPYAGVAERLNIYGFMVWALVLAVILLRSTPQRR